MAVLCFKNKSASISSFYLRLITGITRPVILHEVSYHFICDESAV